MPGIWDEILAEAEYGKERKDDHCVIADGSLCPTCGKADRNIMGCCRLSAQNVVRNLAAALPDNQINIPVGD